MPSPSGAGRASVRHPTYSRTMGFKTTVLRTQRHGEFLTARHQDPVTRKVFTAGDRVTLCAACLKPFLEASWGGMGGTHCGQSVTIGLEAFETTPPPTADESSGNSGADDTEGDTDGEPDNAAPNTGLGLRPVRVKLYEVPIKLLS